LLFLAGSSTCNKLSLSSSSSVTISNLSLLGFLKLETECSSSCFFSQVNLSYLGCVLLNRHSSAFHVLYGLELTVKINASNSGLGSKCEVNFLGFFSFLTLISCYYYNCTNESSGSSTWAAAVAKS